MATRRKYKVQHFRDGGVVKDVGSVAEDAAPEPAASPPAASPPQTEESPLARALAAARHAEALQHQAAQRQPTEHERFVDAMPGLNDRKRNFLKQNPELMRPGIAEIAGRHYQEALAAGIADDSPEIERHIIESTARELASHREPEPAKPAPAALSPAAPQRRSMPMSAPVSRNIPTANGRREPDGWNKLSAEEVRIAHNSFTDPNVSNVEKERMYLANKRRYLSMKADGSYSDQGSG